MCIHIYIYTHTCAFVYIYIYICIHVFMHIHIYIHAYIYTYIHERVYIYTDEQLIIFSKLPRPKIKLNFRLPHNMFFSGVQGAAAPWRGSGGRDSRFQERRSRFQEIQLYISLQLYIRIAMQLYSYIATQLYIYVAIYIERDRCVCIYIERERMST